MNMILYMLRNINVLNLSLAAMAAVFFIFFLNPLLHAPVYKKDSSPNHIADEKVLNAHEAIRKPFLSDYSLIAEENIFHPDRVVPPVKMPATSVPKPEFVLYGTLITSEVKFAYVENKNAAPTPSANPPTRQIALKEGDTVSGYTLKQIEENRIILSNGEEQMTLYLDESKDRKGEITGTGRTRPTAPQKPPTGRGAASAQQPMPIQPPRPTEPVSRPGSPSRKISPEQEKPITRPNFPPLPGTSPP